MNNLFKGLLLSFLVITPLHAEEQPLWKKVGGWKIHVDTSLSNSCFAIQAFEGNSYLRLGINKSDGGAYLMLGDLDWKSLEEGKKYPVNLLFGELKPWKAQATAIVMGSTPTLMITTTSTDNGQLLLQEYMEQIDFRLKFNGKQILHLSLRGSSQAGLELLKCQESIDKTRKKDSDPFDNNSNSQPENDDPFLDA